MDESAGVHAHTLMWEAEAAEGRGAELLAWLLEAVPTGQVFASEDRVVLVLGLESDGDGDAAHEQRSEASVRPEDMVPPPPQELVARPPHAARFARVRSS